MGYTIPRLALVRTAKTPAIHKITNSIWRFVADCVSMRATNSCFELAGCVSLLRLQRVEHECKSLMLSQRQPRIGLVVGSIAIRSGDGSTNF